MANYKSLKTTINANVKRNGNQEITGQILNSVLNAMVDTLGTGYSFAGVATPSTNPGSPDAKVFYIANGKGTYTLFGGLEVTEDEVVVLYWDTLWQKASTGIAREGNLTKLVKEIATKQDIIPDLDAIRSGALLGTTALQEETDPSVPFWAKKPTKPSYTPSEIGAASEEALQSHMDDNTRHITATERAEWNAKQDALTLTIKDNGNIVLSNIQGQSKEFMPATPSGDPMHYAYVAAGAEYNDTGADIIKTTPWADMLDDDYVGDYGKTVVHKAGYWYLNGLGDITNDEIRKIYQASANFPPGGDWISYFGYADYRTNFKGVRQLTGYVHLNASGVLDGSRAFIVLNLNCLRGAYIKVMHTFASAYHVLGSIIMFVSTANISNSKNLVTIPISYLKYDISLSTSSKLSVKSVLFMIQNEAATSAITITLHADAYARAMANADIVAALEAHPNVSLASA